MLRAKRPPPMLLLLRGVPGMIDGISLPVAVSAPKAECCRSAKGVGARCCAVDWLRRRLKRISCLCVSTMSCALASCCTLLAPTNPKLINLGVSKVRGCMPPAGDAAAEGNPLGIPPPWSRGLNAPAMAESTRGVPGVCGIVNPGAGEAVELLRPPSFLNPSAPVLALLVNRFSK
jgi:hypothetical protein